MTVFVASFQPLLLSYYCTWNTRSFEFELNSWFRVFLSLCFLENGEWNQWWWWWWRRCWSVRSIAVDHSFIVSHGKEAQESSQLVADSCLCAPDAVCPWRWEGFAACSPSWLWESPCFFVCLIFSFFFPIPFIIVMFAIRQCVAWASTLITHKHSPKEENHRNKKSSRRKLYPFLHMLPAWALSTVFIPSFSTYYY